MKRSLFGPQNMAAFLKFLSCFNFFLSFIKFSAANTSHYPILSCGYMASL